MKLFAPVMIAIAAACFLASGSFAEDKKDKPKESTLTGTIVCAKCTLKEKGVAKCTTAVQVKDGDKLVTYYLDDKGSKEDYHEAVCGGGVKKEGTVTGVVSEKDGKKWVKPSKVEYKKA